MDRFARPVDLSQHGGIARILNGGVEIGLDEVEEGLEVGVSAVLGLLLSLLSDLLQEGEDLLGGSGSKFPILAEMTDKLGQGRAIRLNRIFFPNSSCGTLGRLEPLDRVSWRVSFPGCG